MAAAMARPEVREQRSADQLRHFAKPGVKEQFAKDRRALWAEPGYKERTMAMMRAERSRKAQGTGAFRLVGPADTEEKTELGLSVPDFDSHTSVGYMQMNFKSIEGNPGYTKTGQSMLLYLTPLMDKAGWTPPEGTKWALQGHKLSTPDQAGDYELKVIRVDGEFMLRFRDGRFVCTSGSNPYKAKKSGGIGKVLEEAYRMWKSIASS
ncbi:hypothetical protein R3P38DRAFT_2831405 [Favolaschia claudopus]|uniref:Lipoprotein n=1 Tax=Favolaschia claudopus TaxID=2862362 RepID=A0AAW0EC57_9AGAR